MNQSGSHQEHVAILGAGISGLTMAWLLSKRGVQTTVFESTDRIGGLARSFNWHGVDCDIAPHRLHTHNKELLNMLAELVPLRHHQRRSRILMGGKVIRDPINPIELCRRFPLKVSSKLVGGFLWKPKVKEDSFEGLALNRYGKGLYEFFFKPYTIKMFGVPPSEISATWGRQKLRSSGLLDALKRNSKTFFRGFHYPEKGGYGSICNEIYKKIKGSVKTNATVIGLSRSKGQITAVHYIENGKEKVLECDRLISTIPATILGKMLGHDFNLRFRTVQLVYLNVNKPQVMPYHWVYFGDGDVVINRLAEFKNFNPGSGPENTTVLCAEVTVDTDTALEDVLTALERYQLVKRSDVTDAMVLPEKHSYPVYDKGFDRVKEQAEELFGQYGNLHCVGRNSEFRHIDLDENMESALVEVDKIYGDFVDESQVASHSIPAESLDAVISSN